MGKFNISKFVNKHIGPSQNEISVMLNYLGIKNLNQLIDQIIPKNIQLNRDLNLSDAIGEHKILKKCLEIGNLNKIWRNYIGLGFYNCLIPAPIVRNVFENPGWYTSYTPYQSEISQGRLECLFNFQTLISELTGLPIANASLLDEASAGAEALTMSYRINKRKKYVIYAKCHPQTLAVVKTRAKFLDIEILEVENNMDLAKRLNETVSGIMFQYPNTEGEIIPNMAELSEIAHKNGCVVSVATDLLSLCSLAPPSHFDCDITFGSCQRLGTFMAFGGPHAAFFAAKSAYLRLMPGRIVGLTKDSSGNRAFRLMLQTREQHIKREKATSNICTAQALLANMTALYAIYHGPDDLRGISATVHQNADILRHCLISAGHTVKHSKYFDTLKIYPKIGMDLVKARAAHAKINLRYFADNSVGISLDETAGTDDVRDILKIFDEKPIPLDKIGTDLETQNSLLYPRSTPFLAQSVFNDYHSETEFVRYLKRLENKDLSLTNSMIPLGSCTMKLNATTELMPLSWPNFADIHPYAPREQTIGYDKIIKELEFDLCEITGMDAVSFQSNSGAQGEYSGLCTILAYLKNEAGGNDADRNICLIPNSSHGTNFSSASLAGMRIVPVNTDKNGYIIYEHFEQCIQENGKELACLMITYPSTHGCFDPNIRKICDKIHESGGLVYMDGANMNAQIGLCRPGDFGADVCHLNLHKTFCIPHGGGGPGMGPIAVKSKLAPYLPNLNIRSTLQERENLSDKSFGAISASQYGSAILLLISWMYIKLMGPQGIKLASQIAILNANYICKRLEGHYDIHRNDANAKDFRCGHEFLLDLRTLKQSHGIEPMDIAKRLQDFNYHAPTVSFPVSTCLMIEPTESENKRELDNFCEAMITIREEINDIAKGVYTKFNNPLKNAPHTQNTLVSDDWKLPYSRRKAAFPMEMNFKVWPSVSRVNEVLGDKNPKCKYD
ncbi:unnamed protein product [Gordionus sp. m RMFG-2023]